MQFAAAPILGRLSDRFGRKPVLLVSLAGSVAGYLLFAFARSLHVGETLGIPSPAGEQQLPIVGEFRDFNTGVYSVVVSLDWFRRYWRDSSITGIGVYVDAGSPTMPVEARVRTVTPQPTRIRSADAIRKTSPRDLRQNFPDHRGASGFSPRSSRFSAC
jgi:hypothetical protein